MIRWAWSSTLAALVFCALALPRPAAAYSVYSRKYATSCATCHTVYPKLTAFGEAFRRNGYRFPGTVDSDYIKQELVPMGHEAAKKDFPNALWPSFMTSPPPLGFFASGSIVTHPDRSSQSAIADKRTPVTLDRLATRATMYAAGDIDDNLTYLALLSFSDTATTLEQSLLVWSDVVGPKHWANLSFGYSFPTLTPFGRGSAFAGGRLTAASAMGTLFGHTGAPFRVTNKYNLIEVNGILGGRLEYGAGMAAGTHTATEASRAPANYYGHLAYKLGGMRLDGEGGPVTSDPTLPWAERAATVWAYAYRGNTIYTSSIPVTAPAKPPQVTDASTTLGGGLRVQLTSFELTLGGLWEDHPRITAVAGADGQPGQATQVAASAELSYIVYPWLVPAVRAEHLIVSPRGGKSASNTRFTPAIAMQPRANLKLSVSASLESTSGPPDAGAEWSKLSGDGANQPKSVTTAVGLELASVTVSASFGF